MFSDHVTIQIHSGNGGNGSAHFHRAKYNPFGGPDGGDGGRGGSIYIRATSAENTLGFYAHHKLFKAAHGKPGGKQRMHGASGEDLILEVPCGTILRDAVSNQIIGDLLVDEQQSLVARGGKGGLGNVHFATSTNQAPQEAQLGEPGEERQITLELRLIADVGIIGYPNAGKSTLLSVVTAAKPKIAAYPFTTLSPNIGVVSLQDDTSKQENSFVLADIPGLIEGASEGIGLGHEFLRHIARTRLLLHILDGSVQDHDPWQDMQIINEELQRYDKNLARRAQIVVFNKMDIPEARERWEAFQQQAEEADVETYAISAATHQGTDTLMQKVVERLRTVRKEESTQDSTLQEERVILRPQASESFTIEKQGNAFYLRGKQIERLVQMANPDSDEALMRLRRQFNKMGILRALQEQDIQEGSIIYCGGKELEWDILQ